METKIPGWEIKKGRLSREFSFSNFRQAFAFMTEVALLAEKQDHHPDWSNSYNKVSIALITHSAGRITEKDMSLALAINDLASRTGFL